MIANMEAFNYTDPTAVNNGIRQQLEAVQTQAAALEKSLDLLMNKVRFEDGETSVFMNLLDALVGFRTVSVNPGTPMSIMMAPETIEKLLLESEKQQKSVDDIISDLVSHYENAQKAAPKGKLQRALEKIEPLANKSEMKYHN